MGGHGRNTCSARSLNFLRTYKAQVGVADGAPPTVAIAANTPLARGAWVGGFQPLNYNATDNVVLLVFTEFGRRVHDNGSGSDHGSGDVHHDH